MYEIETLAKFITYVNIDKLKDIDARPKQEEILDYLIVSDKIDCEELFTLTSQVFMKKYICNPVSMSQDIRMLQERFPTTVQKLQEVYKIQFI